MLIGDRYKDTKMYSGIKHYNHLPLTSDDIHEYFDTTHMKHKYLLNNLLGCGTLEKVDISITNHKLSMSKPCSVLIDGDVVLLYSDRLVDMNGTDQIPISYPTRPEDRFLLCAVGWYQHITSSSTLRSYGGFMNPQISNDITDPNLGMQLSTRYQFVWDTVIIPRDYYVNLDFYDEAPSFYIANRDESGYPTGNIPVYINSKIGRIGKCRVQDGYEDEDIILPSDIYLIPLSSITYHGGSSYSLSSITPITEHMTYALSKENYMFQVTDKSLVPRLDAYERIIGYDRAFRLSDNCSSKDIASVTCNGVLLQEGVHYSIGVHSGEYYGENKALYLVIDYRATVNEGDEIVCEMLRLSDSVFNSDSLESEL